MCLLQCTDRFVKASEPKPIGAVRSTQLFVPRYLIVIPCIIITRGFYVVRDFRLVGVALLPESFDKGR